LNQPFNVSSSFTRKKTVDHRGDRTNGRWPTSAGRTFSKRIRLGKQSGALTRTRKSRAATFCDTKNYIENRERGQWKS